MDVGARIWIPDLIASTLSNANQVWLPASIQSIDARDPKTATPMTVTVQVDELPIIDSPSKLIKSNQRSQRQPVSSLSPRPSRIQQVELQYQNGECTNAFLQNQETEQDRNDLVTLPHLHEASILQSLRLRYARDVIYTRIGDILISINPFKDLEDLYTDLSIQQYAMEAFDEDQHTAMLHQTPHLFGVAKAAYLDVVRNHRNQSILISGESGAGKTEATKIIMKYFAFTRGSTTHIKSQELEPVDKKNRDCESNTSSIESQVLQSNPILEAFGNARTVRNDNSSRFGKFIQLQLNDQHYIAGASISTYLLEKIRVIKQAPQERSFHIFYELLSAIDSACQSKNLKSGDDQKEICEIATFLPTTYTTWGLTSPQQFSLLNQHHFYQRGDGVSDTLQFQKTIRAMQHIGMSDLEIESVLEIVAAVLHIGNIQVDDEVDQPTQVLAAKLRDESEHFQKAAALLGVSTKDLEFALTRRRLVTARETLVVGMDVDQAHHTRNALAMECYRLLFEWIVSRINATIQPSDEIPTDVTIGLLDIFGFEDMTINSFEQLCINYANETLQHQFNEYVFTAEQLLYQQEGLAWDQSFSCPNNAACLELYEKKPMGLFSLLDQECLVPQGSDAALLAKYYTEFEKKAMNPYFQSAGALQCKTQFVIVHYAGKVTYSIPGFLMKNKDSFCDTAAALLAASSNAIIQKVAIGSNATFTPSAIVAPLSNDTSAASAPSTPRLSVRRAKSSIAATSVATQFKQQLSELLDTIRSTMPHFVRCIKPNDTNTCDHFDCPRVVEQLRSGGVLEAVRVARAGYPIRMPHQQFLDRYERVLRIKSKRNLKYSIKERLELYVKRIQTLNNDGTMSIPAPPTSPTFRKATCEGVHIGKTRIFFRREPYEKLERFRAQCLRAKIILLQRQYRRHFHQQRFARYKHAIVSLQARYRGRVTRQCVDQLRANRLATKIQTCVRRYWMLHKYQNFRTSVIILQNHLRRRKATHTVDKIRRHQAATRITSSYRSYQCRIHYHKFQSAIRTLQRQRRVQLAKRVLCHLRLESKNVAKLQHDNLQLKDELSQLRLQLVAMQQQALTKAASMQVIPEAEGEPQDSIVVMEAIKEGDENNNNAAEESPNVVGLPIPTASLLKVDAIQPSKPVVVEQVRLSTPNASSKPIRTIDSFQMDPILLSYLTELEMHALQQILNDSASSSDEEQELLVQRFVVSRIKAKLLQQQPNIEAIPSTPKAASCVTEIHSPAPKIQKRSESYSVATLSPLNNGVFPFWKTGIGMRETMEGSGSLPHRHSLFFDDESEDEGPNSILARSMSMRLRTSSSWRGGGIPRWCKDSQCKECGCKFTFLIRRHHCRQCGNSFCYEHSTRRLYLPHLGYADPQRVCDGCFEQFTVELDRVSMESSSSRYASFPGVPIAPMPPSAPSASPPFKMSFPIDDHQMGFAMEQAPMI